MSNAKDAVRLLDPVNPPIALHEEYVQHEQVTLVLNAKLFASGGDDYKVADTTGKEYLSISAKSMSAHEKKIVHKLDGRVLYDYHRKLHLLNKVIVDDDAGNPVFTVEEKLSFGSKLVCHLKDSTGKEVELLVGGGKFGSDADITLENGQVVGTISRDLTTDKMMLKNKQAWHVTVAAGVDVSVMTILCLCWNDLKKVQGRRWAASAGGP